MTINAKAITQISILGALSFISGFIAIPLGPVPITLQTIFVLLSGLLLHPKAAFFSQVIHMLLKLFIVGGQAVLTPSFGFHFGFIAAAAIMAKWLAKRKGTATDYAVAVIIGSILIYLIGLPYMALILNGYLKAGYTATKIMWVGMGLFIPGDILKASLAVFIAKRLKKQVRSMV